jgi:hypothetical protein
LSFASLLGIIDAFEGVGQNTNSNH